MRCGPLWRGWFARSISQRCGAVSTVGGPDCVEIIPFVRKVMSTGLIEPPNVRDEHQSSWSVRSVFINEKWCLSMTILKKSKILNLYWWFGEKSQIPLDQFIIWFVDLGGKNHRLRRECLKAASFWCPRFPYLLAAWSFPWPIFFVEKMVQMVIRLSEFIMYFIIFNWGWIELEYVLFPDHERSPWHLDFVFSLILSGFHLTNTWLY